MQMRAWKLLWYAAKKLQIKAMHRASMSIRNIILRQ